MRYLLPFLLLPFTAVAQADELVLHTFSYHYKEKYETTKTTNYVDENGNKLYSIDDITFHKYNNVNLGVGWKTDSGWMIGSYRNSYMKPSAYVGKEFMFTHNFGMVLGAVTGYKEHTGHSIYPMAAFEYKIRLTDKTTANIFFTPPITNENVSGVAHLTISQKF